MSNKAVVLTCECSEKSLSLLNHPDKTFHYITEKMEADAEEHIKRWQLVHPGSRCEIENFGPMSKVRSPFMFATTFYQTAEIRHVRPDYEDNVQWGE